jgi:hypothetical protein
MRKTHLSHEKDARFSCKGWWPPPKGQHPRSEREAPFCSHGHPGDERAPSFSQEGRSPLSRGMVALTRGMLASREKGAPFRGRRCTSPRRSRTFLTRETQAQRNGSACAFTSGSPESSRRATDGRLHDCGCAPVGGPIDARRVDCDAGRLALPRDEGGRGPAYQRSADDAWSSDVVAFRAVCIQGGRDGSARASSTRASLERPRFLASLPRIWAIVRGWTVGTGRNLVHVDVECQGARGDGARGSRPSGRVC